ncbi:hypothetical protein ACTXT7_010593 [Hymenolepis weldensis]
MPSDRFIIYDKTLRILAHAIKENDLKKLQTIIDKDVVLKPYLTEIDTAVHYAAAFNRQECLKLLIDNDFSLGAVDRFGCTPLDIAAMLGHLEMVCFIARQLPKECLAESALNAARYAAFRRQKSVVMLLLKYANDDVDIFRDTVLPFVWTNSNEAEEQELIRPGRIEHTAVQTPKGEKIVELRGLEGSERGSACGLCVHPSSNT